MFIVFSGLLAPTDRVDRSKVRIINLTDLFVVLFRDIPNYPRLVIAATH